MFPSKKRVFENAVRQSNDGPHFLHMFRTMEGLLHTENPDRLSQILLTLEQIANQIQRRFDASRDSPAHFEKVRWFAQYWNETLPPINRQIPRIIGRGLDPHAATWG
jgi:hypothetical protein